MVDPVVDLVLARRNYAQMGNFSFCNRNIAVEKDFLTKTAHNSRQNHSEPPSNMAISTNPAM